MRLVNGRRTAPARAGEENQDETMRTILTVDDSTSMRQMVRATLQSAGYDVVEAADGQEALEFARGKAVDLVISDVNMPRMDGITLVQRAARAAGLPADAAAVADHRVEPGQEAGRQARGRHGLDRQALQSGAAADHAHQTIRQFVKPRP